eukprot:3285504-Prymnesium_polylepis.1
MTDSQDAAVTAGAPNRWTSLTEPPWHSAWLGSLGASHADSVLTVSAALRGLQSPPESATAR